MQIDGRHVVRDPLRPPGYEAGIYGHPIIMGAFFWEKLAKSAVFSALAVVSAGRCLGSAGSRSGPLALTGFGLDLKL